MSGRNQPASSASSSSGDGPDRCQYDDVPFVYGSAGSSRTHVLLEAAEDFLRSLRHLVNEVAAIEVEAFGA